MKLDRLNTQPARHDKTVPPIHKKSLPGSWLRKRKGFLAILALIAFASAGMLKYIRFSRKCLEVEYVHAVKSGAYKDVVKLLRIKPSLLNTPGANSIGSGKERNEVTKLLIQRGIQIGGMFEKTSACHNAEIMEYLLVHKSDEITQIQREASLRNAAWTGDAEITRLLLNYGAQGELAGETSERYLMEWRLFYSLRRYGATPLHDCAWGAGMLKVSRGPEPDYNEVARILVAHGIDINAKDASGSTPLFYCDVPELAEQMLDMGANVRIRNNYGATPLHHAVRWVWRTREAEALATCLLDAGAEVNAKDNEGRTALDLATIESRSSMVEILNKYMIQTHVPEQE